MTDIATLGIKVDTAQVRTASGDLDKLAQSGQRAGASAGSLTSNFMTMRGAIATLGIGAFVKSVVEAGVASDRLSNSLKFSAGSAAAAAKEMDYLKQTAERLGLEINTTADAYIKLAASSKGTSLEGEHTKQIFEAISEASTVMGLSAEQTGGALLAISQMMSKGTVAAEELRGQLGERLPGAFQIAARAMGTTTAEFGKMLEQGQIVADDFLPKFAEELRKSLGDSPDSAAGSAQAQLNRLSNSWTEFKKTIAESGVMTVTLQVVEGSTNALKWFDHFVFNKGELADTQNYLNSKPRLSALRNEQELLLAGGNRLDPSNTLEYRQKRLAEIAAEMRGIQKSVGTLPNGNAAPGKYAITGGIIMPLTAHDQILSSTGKATGGGYGPDINKLHEQMKKSAGHAPEDDYARTLAEDTARLMQSFQQAAAPAQTLSERLQDQLNNYTNLSPSVKTYLQGIVDQTRATEEATKAAEAWNEMAALQRESDERELAALEANSAAEERYQLQLEQRAQALRETLDPSLKLLETQAQYNAMLDAGVITQDEYTAALERMGEKAKDTNDFAHKLGLTFSSAFEEAAFSANSFRDVLSGLAQDLGRLILRKKVTEPLFSAFSDMLPDFSFGGGRAVGGSVDPSKVYMVGEKGPELFKPSSSGSIVPNDKLGGNQYNVEITVNADGSARQENGNAGELGRRIESAVRGVLLQERRPGGLLAA